VDSMGHPPNLPLWSSTFIAIQVFASRLCHDNARRSKLAYKESGCPLAHPTHHLGSWKESARSKKPMGHDMDDVFQDALVLVQERKLT
jgi:hypothetical protein